MEELFVSLAATEQEKSLLAVTSEDVQSLRLDCLHSQLPLLEDAGLITWDREAGTVTTTDAPAFADPQFRHIIETDADNWDEILDALTHQRRRIALAILRDQDEPMERRRLARAIATEESVRQFTPDTESIKTVCASLHHVHLPKLQQTGLVACDADAGTVAYEGHPALDRVRFRSLIDATPRGTVPTAHRSEDIWSIEGRDDVIARGQSLFEQADDELFLMITTDGLLEAECISGLEAAIERGVDVYLGSQTREVRDLVRERLPAAVIWEPQLDWLNLPPDYEKVGRLVFADREAILLGTIGTRGEEGIPRETAITGSGENNPLVVLMRDMLGSRLDHLDAQSADVRSQIPL